MMRPAGPDLFDLTPKVPSIEAYTLVAWYDLERPHGALKVGGPSTGKEIRVLGYMMDGDSPIQNGHAVSRFVLLPDAGTAVHPAHRIGDQMIEVQLKRGTSILFNQGAMVWVWGTWKTLTGAPASDKPLYQIQDAHIENADHADVAKYFR